MLIIKKSNIISVNSFVYAPAESRFCLLYLVISQVYMYNLRNLSKKTKFDRQRYKLKKHVVILSHADTIIHSVVIGHVYLSPCKIGRMDGWLTCHFTSFSTVL